MKNVSNMKGLAAVEMVLVLPLMLMVLIGTLEFSRAFVEHNTLTKAVRTGARFAIQNIGGTANNICGQVTANASNIQNVVVYGNIGGTGDSRLDSLNTSNITVSCDTATKLLSITANYTFQPALITQVPFAGHSLTVPMSATHVLRTEQ